MTTPDPETPTVTTDVQPQPPALDLGGGIRVHPGILTPELVPIDAVTEHPRNPRRGDTDALSESVDENGLYDQIKVQRSTGWILSGNHTHRTLRRKGATQAPVVWLDVDDTEATRIMLSANRTGDRGGYESKLLVELLRDDLGGDLRGTAYADDTYDLLLALDADEHPLIGTDHLYEELLGPRPTDDDEGERGPTYTRRTDAIRYEPSMDAPPPVESLIDTTKRDRLQERIREALAAGELDAETAHALTLGAERHLVFNYANLAEFYAHASPAVQALMEESALVLVDFNDAIQHGFVRLSSRLEELLAADLETRADLDAQGGYRADRDALA